MNEEKSAAQAEGDLVVVTHDRDHLAVVDGLGCSLCPRGRHEMAEGIEDEEVEGVFFYDVADEADGVTLKEGFEVGREFLGAVYDDVVVFEIDPEIPEGSLDGVDGAFTDVTAPGWGQRLLPEEGLTIGEGLHHVEGESGFSDVWDSGQEDALPPAHIAGDEFPVVLFGVKLVPKERRFLIWHVWAVSAMTNLNGLNRLNEQWNCRPYAETTFSIVRRVVGKVNNFYKNDCNVIDISGLKRYDINA